jgi:HEAT repeat protein
MTSTDTTTAGGGTRLGRQKKIVRDILERRDREGLVEWAGGRKKGINALLAMLLYETDELMRWRCIEGLGLLAADLAPRGLEQLRDIVRRLLWTMNDESGNVGWFAPEAIGEILASVPRLAKEFTDLLPNFLVEEPFERGTHWAMVRVAGAVGHSPSVVEMLEEGAGRLVQSLTDEDAFTRAHAALALKRLGRLTGAPAAAIAADTAPLRTYDFTTGELTDSTVAGLVEQG